MSECRERQGHEYELADRRAVGNLHESRVVAPGAPERNEALYARQDKRQHKGVVSDLGDH
jgi:hypothetical protein